MHRDNHPAQELIICFKTLEGCSDFDLIVDLTRSNSTQTPRATFIERFLDLCPKVILAKWKSIVLFQPNIDSPRLLMNIHMLLRVLGKNDYTTHPKPHLTFRSAGASIDVSVVTAATPSEILKHTAMSSLKLSRDSCESSYLVHLQPTVIAHLNDF